VADTHKLGEPAARIEFRCTIDEWLNQPVPKRDPDRVNPSASKLIDVLLCEPSVPASWSAGRCEWA
jgi:hypothetical protein